MTSNFTVDEIINALYRGVLGREPDPEGYANMARDLTEGPSALPQVLANLLESTERQSLASPRAWQDEMLNALYRASLGRAPDNAGRKTYGHILHEQGLAGLGFVAEGLYNSAEYQDRLLPHDPDRLIVDHSPHGEFRALLAHLVAGSGGPRTIVEAGVTDPSACLSLDLARVLGWRALLIETSPKLKVGIEARLAGLNYELVDAAVIEPDLVTSAPWDDQESRRRRAVTLGLLPPKEAPPAPVSLTAVLEGASIDPDFEVLALGPGRNTAVVLNELMAERAFKPRFVILGITLPADCVSLTQLGLNAAVTEMYEVGSSTPGSTILKRIQPVRSASASVGRLVSQRG